MLAPVAAGSGLLSPVALLHTASGLLPPGINKLLLQRARRVFGLALFAGSRKATESLFLSRHLRPNTFCSGPVFLAQFFLQDLPSTCLRQCIHELNRTRAFVVRKASADKLQDIGPQSLWLPALSETSALGTSPQRSSGMGITATSYTSGWASMAFSTSSDDMFSPPLTMMSFLRSTMSK